MNDGYADCALRFSYGAYTSWLTSISGDVLIIRIEKEGRRLG